MTTDSHRDWPLRAALLAVTGAAVGFAGHRLVQGAQPYLTTEDPLRLAAATWLVVTAIVYAFVVERDRQPLSAGVAVLAGTIVASVIYWNGGDGPGRWSGGEPWRLTCALLAIAIGAPLFQAWRGARGQGGGIPYVAAHNHAWTNVVLWFAAWLFVAISFGLAYLLSELFELIGIHVLHRLLETDWFGWTLCGAAFGGAVGLLRDRERVLGTLQRVVMTVLGVLAPVLAVGLLVFLAALPFTGLAPLWGATKSTTPILLGCVIGALILANAVIGDAPEDRSRRSVLRWAALGLGIAMLPLAVIAAVSTGARIEQYGLTPDRLWAVVFTACACAYGLAYLVAVVRARQGWAIPARTANLRLALALCGVALLLSTPLLSFGAISTRDQIARLESGRTSLQKFDWTALRFDFGPPGKAALDRLAKSGATPAIRSLAATAVSSNNRWAAQESVEQRRQLDTLDARLVMRPAKLPLPGDLRERVSLLCGQEKSCLLIYAQPYDEAIVVSARFGSIEASRIEKGVAGWAEPKPAAQTPSQIAAERAQMSAATARRQAALQRGDVDVREVRRRQVFIGGEPVGDLLPEAPAAAPAG